MSFESKPTEVFNFGDIIKTSLGVFLRNIYAHLFFSFFAIGIPFLLIAIFSTQNITNKLLEFTSSSTADIILSFCIILFLFLAYAIHACLAYNLSLHWLDDENYTIVETLNATATTLIPVIFITSIYYLGAAVGLVLLIIPGLYLSVIWSLAPVIVVSEKLPVIAALKRSAELTSRYRWQIFGTLIIINIATEVISIIWNDVIPSIFNLYDPAKVDEGTLEDTELFWSWLIEFPVSFLALSLLPTITTVIFMNLKNKKNGIAAQLLKVFD